MSTSNTVPSKKKVGISRSFLNTTNPEIFEIKPRPGGYVPLVDVSGKKKCDEAEDDGDNNTTAGDKSEKKVSVQEALPEDFSREFRIQKTVYDSTWTLSTINSLDSSEESIEIPTPLADSIDMLSIALSTVMLLAAGVSDIPDVYINWTKSYFETIKDDFGHTPPNIQGILNHLAMIKGSGESTGSRRGSKTVRTTTTVRRRSGSVSSAAKAASTEETAPEAPPEEPAEPPAEPPAEDE